MEKEEDIGMDFLHKILRAVEISRPIFWPSTFIAFTFGVIFSKNLVTPQVILFAFLWSFPYSLWIRAANDLADQKSDEKNPYKGGLSGTVVGPNERNFVQQLLFISLAVIAVPTLLTGNLYLWAFSFLALLFPYIYSTHPIRLKERPPLDSFSNGAFTASVFLAGVFFHGLLKLTVPTIQATLGFFLGVSAIHIIGALRDYSTDKEDMIRTIAVTFGQRQSAAAAGLLFLTLYITITTFPIEFRLYSLYGIVASIALVIKPGEKQTAWLGLTLLLGFFATGLYSIVTGSWVSLF